MVAGALFFVALDDLWPLARFDLVFPRTTVRQEARSFLERRGFDLSGYRSSSRLDVDTAALDYVDGAFGRDRAQHWVEAGLPLVSYEAYFKRRGEVVGYRVRLHPRAGVLGWTKTVPEDQPSARIPVEQARGLARAALGDGLGLDTAAFEERSAGTAERPESRTHTFGFERTLEADPELIERATVTVLGDEVVAANRLLRIPEAATRRARAAEAPGVALETAGFALVALGAAGAFFVFLRRLRDGEVRLARAAIWPGVVFACLLGTYGLEESNLFAHWEPLWPQWVSTLRYLVFAAIQEVWIVVVLLAVVASGDALDRAAGGARARSLWALARGEILDPAVARASARGFLVGLLCGGTIAAAVLGLRALGWAETAIQPRGFFFYTLNSAAPAVTSLLFFLGVALAEELGYRFFGGGWLAALGARRWVAILVPAVIYGLAHTRLDFLPPAEPFWGRAFVLTLVGCVWGWAFFRYDALTVVLSHLTADLFIFNWPRLAASDRPLVVLVSALTVAVPLAPALLGLLVPASRNAGSP